MLLLTLSTLAMAQERLDAPGASISAEDGAAAPWVNPANLGFDPDASLGLWYRQTLTDASSQVAISTTAGGTGLGVVFRTDDAGNPWWGLNTAVSFRLPENVRLGTNVNWFIPAGQGNNFVAWDVGAGWRPLPWLGVGAVALNLGSPAPDFGVWAQYGVSATVRPLKDHLELSVDFRQYDPASDVAQQQVLSGVLRTRPVEGMVVRAQVDTNPQDFSQLTYGAGLELYWDGLGGGAWVGDNADSLMVYGATGPMDERFVSGGKKVPLIELSGGFPYQPSDYLFSSVAQESYVHLLERLDEASTDRHVKGVVLDLDGMGLNWAQVEELRGAVARIRAEEKPVVAYLGGGPSNGAYYLATSCDKVYLHPAGQLDLVGLSLESQYFRGALDLVGVEPQYAKRAEYKAAPEQWTNTEPSDAAREQMNALLDDIFNTMVDGIAAGRNMAREQVIALIDGGPYTAKEALDKGLVDGLVYPDQVEGELEGVFPKGYDLDDEYRMISETSGWESPKQVAIIYVEGPITSGESGGGGLFSGGNTGSDTVVRYLLQAAEDGSVKAVVLRVDSPGGSAFASDEIWRAVKIVQEEGKPVVVSMGGVAASGGYYVAAGADAIYAEPTTITGSIGVYGGKFSVGGLYEKVGINYEIYQRGRKASMYTMSRPMDPVEYAAMDHMIEDTYTLFKSRVAEGRDMTMEEVDKVARGRVWSGVDAQAVGLVDEIGGLWEAVERAKVEAGLDPNTEVDLVTYRGSANAWGDVPKTAAQALFPQVSLPEPFATWMPYAALADEGVLLLMPEHIEVK